MRRRGFYYLTWYSVEGPEPIFRTRPDFENWFKWRRAVRSSTSIPTAYSRDLVLQGISSVTYFQSRTVELHVRMHFGISRFT